MIPSASTESPRGSYPGSLEIQLEESQQSEHPMHPLIPDLTKPPSRRREGSFKEWITRCTTIVKRAADPIETPTTPLDLKLGGLFKYHLKDWLLIVILIGLEILCQLVTPYKRYVGKRNFVTSQLTYPYQRNTVPFQAVPVIALVVPLVVIVSYFFWKRNVRDTHHAILGLLTAVALTAVITDSVKSGIGRPRPHFYARCFGSPLATPNYDPTTGNVICNLAANSMKEAYKSFPSGHTSWSFAGLGYLAMYLAGKLSIFDKKGHSWKVFPVMLPLLGATFVGVTRIDDYWHHWTDVCAGATLGLLSAYFCYRQHFPSLFDDESHMPYAYIPYPRTVQALAPASNADWPVDPARSPYDLERGSS